MGIFLVIPKYGLPQDGKVSTTLNDMTQIYHNKRCLVQHDSYQSLKLWEIRKRDR